MPQDIKIWGIEGENNLKEIGKSPLDLEKRLEDWIAKDISIVSDDYLIIGKQVETAFGKKIDLLCLDSNGEVVILELKRDKTPRDVVAQALDYASWVNDLSQEDILYIANKNFIYPQSLEKAFFDKFKTQLPETINEEHSMLIIASTIDSSTERIVRYLSDKHNMAINVIQFQYHKNDDGKEFLSRIFLIKPEIVKPFPKRRQNLSVNKLQEIADENGVGEIYSYIFKELLEMSGGVRTTQSSIGFVGKDLMEDNKTSVFFNLIPLQSDEINGLKFQIYLLKTARFFNSNEKTIESFLPQSITKWHFLDRDSPEWSGYEGNFKNIQDAENFIQGLKKIKS